MQSLHAASAVDVVFDEPNLIVDAGLVPAVALAEHGLPDLVSEHVTIVAAGNSAGANAAAKVTTLLAGMVAGADCILDGVRSVQPHGASTFQLAGTRCRAAGLWSLADAHRRCGQICHGPGVWPGTAQR